MTPELRAALDDLLAVAGQVASGDLARPSPCAGWDVRRLLEHVVGWQRVFAACARDIGPPFDGESPTYRASADPVADLRISAADLADALRERTRPVELPFRGTTPVAAHVEELVAETVLHTWDLATAVGARPSPAPDVLAVAHRGLTRLLGEPFAPAAFAAQAGGASGEGRRRQAGHCGDHRTGDGPGDTPIGRDGLGDGGAPGLAALLARSGRAG